MPTAKELFTGAQMTVEEFLRRWEELPDLEQAELIDGVVYLSSPLSREHARRDSRIIGWLIRYVESTPGCDCGSNGTWLMAWQRPATRRVLEDTAFARRAIVG